MPGTAEAPGKEKVTEGGMGAGLAGTRGSVSGGERVFAARGCGWATAQAGLLLVAAGTALLGEVA